MVLDQRAAAEMVSQCLKLLEKFAWLLDCYVLDFFVDDHWSKIPRSWQVTLREMSPADMASWLRKGGEDGFRPPKSVMPLELLALRAAVQRLSLDRDTTWITRAWQHTGWGN